MKVLVTICFLLLNLLLFGQEQNRVTFSPLGGKYTKDITVALKAPAAAKIFYTLDGSTPNQGSFRYIKPIEVNSVAVIRAVFYLNGKRSDVITQSYFCDRPYSLPIVSIATNPENLWDYATGIYVKGCCADTIEPYIGANFWRDWEKYANIEMYDEDGTLCFNQEAGINLFGGYSRMLPQKSLAIFARKKYGNNRFEYQLFPNLKEDEYKSFILRNSGGDFQRTHLRDAFMTQLAAPTGVAIQAYRPAIVFLNGEYWGIQNIREKISEHYLESNFNTDKDNVDILRHNGVAREGTSTNYKKLLQFLRTKDMSQQETIDELATFMDIQDFIRYNIAETYSDNRDAGGNIRYWRERTDSAKWRWILYDLDLGLGNDQPNGYKHNTVHKFTNANAEAWPDPAWSTFIIRSLLKNKQLEYEYINTFADHLNTVYKKERAVKLLDEMQEVIREEMPFHVKRWRTSFENWEYHIGLVKFFVEQRPSYLRQFIMEKFDLSDTVAVSIKVPGKDIAAVQFNSLNIEENFEGIYFTDVPVKITVKPKHDYIFMGWKGRSETSNVLSIMLTEDVILEPLFSPNQKSIYADSIIFNELSPYQVEGDSCEDWIELYNRSSTTLDLSNWIFTESTFKKGFKVPANVIILPNSYMILARNQENFSAYFNTDTLNVVGDFDFGLKREGECIKLYDQDGFMVDSLTYPQFEYDSMYTLNRVHPDSINTGFFNWRPEKPNPGGKSFSYLAFLKHEADKAYWTKIYYIGGGSFFFILVGGLLLRRYSNKKKA